MSTLRKHYGNWQSIVRIQGNPVSENSSKIFRRSVYATKHIKKNEKLSEKNIACFRPKVGIGAENYFNLLGKKSKKNIKQFSPIKKNMI